MQEKLILVKAGETPLEGFLKVPDNPRGLVIFIHGSGSSRLSPRNQFVAQTLNDAEMATLLFDLLTDEEEAIDNETDRFRFDIPFLAKRVFATLEWIEKEVAFNGFKIGLFGASTGAAAALVAAAKKKETVAAIVSRGGRPDMADLALKEVQAPTLLIVGSHDPLVLKLNEEAYESLTCEKKLSIIEGASHLFEEKGTLDEAAHRACDWFKKYLN